MKLGIVFLFLVMFGMWTPASGQNTNLLKNPGGENGGEHWRAFKDAKVEQCPTEGRCFVLRGGGYFSQDVAIPKEAMGQYVFLIGRAYTDSPTALPALHGYMMNSGDPSGGRIYAYLSGQQMLGSPDSSHNWTHLWGVFTVKPGTRRIRFFLQQAVLKGEYRDAVTRFDDLGLYILPGELEARAFVGQMVPGASFGATNAVAKNTHCGLSRAVEPSLYGIHLGMSLDDIVSLFPEAVDQTSVARALESSKSSKRAGSMRMLIENRTGNPNLKEVERLFFQFHNRRLFSLAVQYHSPQWENTEEFVDQRRELLNVVTLPQANAWDSVAENSTSGMYLICDGIEIRFYAAPRGSRNKNLISVTDTTVETTLASVPDSQP
jgi:hypothetical protein